MKAENGGVWGMKVNVRKSKVLMIKKDQMGSCKKTRMSGEERQEVDKFNYFVINTDAGMGGGSGSRGA